MLELGLHGTEIKGANRAKQAEQSTAQIWLAQLFIYYACSGSRLELKNFSRLSPMR